MTLQALILPLAQCFASAAAAESLARAAYRTPWDLRVCAPHGIAPITRARITITTFTSDVDGWGLRDGLAALLAWALATGNVGGAVIEFQAAVRAELERLGPA